MAQLWDGPSFDAQILQSIEAYPGTQGSKPLLRAIADLSWCERGMQTDPAEIVCTHGALHGLSVALATLPPGTPVLYPQPAFGYPFAIDRAGVRPVPLDWPVGATVAQLLARTEEHLARVGEPAAVIVCFPANPSGETPTAAECRALREIIAVHRAVLIVDDLYRFADPRPLDLAGEDVILVDSLSKRFGAPGLRFGWVCAKGPRFSALREVAAATSVGVGYPSAILAEHALRRYLAEPGIAQQIRGSLLTRRHSVRAAVPEPLQPDLQLTDAGFYGCLRLPGRDPVLVAASLARRGVRVSIDATLYGPSAPAHVPFVRFCLGSDERVGEAVAALCDEVLRTAHREAA